MLSIASACGGLGACASALTPPASVDAGADSVNVDTDAGLRCAVVMDPPFRAPCGGGGYLECCSVYAEMQCAIWGQALSDAGQSFAQCSFELAPCARADRCVYSDAGTNDFRICNCGSGPACGANQACVAEAPDVTPHCICIANAP